VYRFFFILLIIVPGVLNAQVKFIGTPQIHNYLKSEYNAGTQNWGISQDKKGFMYFANNDGVLKYDGVHWELFEVSQASPVRSIHIDSNDRIFVGLFNDFGVLQQNSSGELKYRSLRDLLPDSTIEFDDIWKIHEIPQGVVFQSFDYVFILNDNRLEIIKPEQQFHFSFNVNGRLFLHEPGVGLYEYINGYINRVPWAGELDETEIWTILNIQDNNLLIGTARNGIYKFENGKLDKWNTPANRLVEDFKLFSATKVGANYFAFGTITSGIIITNYDGEIIQHINKNQGLQNNTVLSLYTDNQQNLWLGLDNGIDFMEINSPVSYISDYDGIGTGYAARIFKEKLYLGTNQGLFVKPFNPFMRNEEDFKLIENTTGQVWSLNVFDNQLICGHNLGSFVIEDNEAIQISNEEGGWKFIRLKEHPEFLLGGHYAGLQLLRKTDEKWQFYKNVEGFNESSRYLLQDEQGRIWVSHGSKGVYKIRLNSNTGWNADYQQYTTEQGLPSDKQNIVFKFKNSVFVSTTNGIYAYDNENDRFIISDELNQLFQFNGRLKTLETDSEGNVWFITEDESGVFRINEDLTYTKIALPFKQLDDKYVNEFEFIYPYNNNNVFLGIDNGFAHYSSKFQKSYSQSFTSFITRVEIPYLDSILLVADINPDKKFEFPFGKNSFRFHFTAPFYENQNKLLFSFLLENFNEEWSPWTTNEYKDYTNLPEGEYTFKVKAKNIYGIESAVAAFDFYINPPWYRSTVAWYIYILLILLLIFLIVKFVLYRLKVAKRKQAQKHREELEKKEERFQHQALVNEKEIIRLRNEKLHGEMIYRDKELANQTMGIIQKNKFLTKLKNELQRIQKATGDGELKTKLATLNRRINREIDNKQQNQLFETYFDEVHEEFFKRLKEEHPELSPREMRLSAYIKMNLSSKEIAALQNISDRGVEISRYRLRKKLDLSRDVNLSTFLSNI